jgi:REP element-mobilizing transposase RayT
MSSFRARPHEPPMPEALAYFLTWPTYGTWLPGDERGWVQYGKGFQPPDPVRKLEAEARMTEDSCVLDMEQRSLVEKTIAEHCRIRGWVLHAANCRTNHLHVIVTAHCGPDKVREQFKAWCTRKLKELERSRLTRSAKDEKLALVRRVRQKWWAERGSCRHIGDVESLDNAIIYVRDGQ